LYQTDAAPGARGHSVSGEGAGRGGRSEPWESWRRPQNSARPL